MAATSACNAWAVGNYEKIYTRSQALRTLIEQWNGKAWKVQQSPNSGGRSANNELTGVAALSSTDAWAVGQYNNGTSLQTLIEHWNGKEWKVQHSPDPGGTSNASVLQGVAAVSPSDAWAVGYYEKANLFHPLIAHFNGNSWKVQHVPTAGRSRRVNGRRLTAAPPVDLIGVVATSSKNAWAVGYDNNGTAHQTLIEHWNGTKWKVQPSKNPGGSSLDNALVRVAAVSGTDAWAVGHYWDGTSDRTLVEHYNGRVWKVQTSANPGGTNGDDLYGVAAGSSRDVWAVGEYGTANSDQPLVERLNGRTWKVQRTLHPPGDSALFGVAATSATDAWAVGNYFNGTVDRTLALQCC